VKNCSIAPDMTAASLRSKCRFYHNHIACQVPIPSVHKQQSSSKQSNLIVSTSEIFNLFFRSYRASVQKNGSKMPRWKLSSFALINRCTALYRNRHKSH